MFNEKMFHRNEKAVERTLPTHKKYDIRVELFGIAGAGLITIAKEAAIYDVKRYMVAY